MSTSSWSPLWRSVAPRRSSSASIGDAGVGDDAAVGPLDQVRRLVDVVLVLDLADDLLDHVLDGDEPVDAAELVDDQRHVDARQAHLHQQVEDRHRRRDEQHLAQHRRELDPGVGRQPAPARP